MKRTLLLTFTLILLFTAGFILGAAETSSSITLIGSTSPEIQLQGRYTIKQPMLTGSGNAAFFSFGPLIPDVAVKLGLQSWEMILPMQLAASMGRATSPIAGVIVAISGVAGVSPVDVAKRNLFPLAGGLVFLQIFHLII